MTSDERESSQPPAAAMAKRTPNVRSGEDAAQAAQSAHAAHVAHAAHHHSGSSSALLLAALGVVYGDIGTSPIYAIREALHGEHGVPPSVENVLGLLSLVFWALVIVISIKYLLFVMRADNDGEGGMIALTALVAPPPGQPNRWRSPLVLVGLFGASLLYGDGMITPAISVLSAVEGLEVVTPAFVPYVVPITVVILLGLFAVQSRGTARIGAVFGPIMLVWFLTLAVLGIRSVIAHPDVLAALNPVHAVRFFAINEWHGFVVLGSVFLVVTGGEALYADMGHFGIGPIRRSWFALVLPSLLLVYFGQGALVIANPSAADHPFFELAPAWARIPLVILATAATVIASQAVISGAFSLTRQAVQLGYLPRMTIRHTSRTQIGQIYIPSLNWILAIAGIGLVVGFRSSSNLAAAYGVAVTTDMVFTTILFAVVARVHWRWSLPALVVMATAFLVVDVAFWGSSLLKIPRGGWFPLVIAAVVFTVMTTWNRGRAILADRLAERMASFEQFLSLLAASPPTRVPGTAVFLARNASLVPQALVSNVRYNKVLHERVVLLAIVTTSHPYEDDATRLTVEEVAPAIYRAIARFGFAEDQHVPPLLERLRSSELPMDLADTTFFLGRESLIATNRPGMAIWRERLFSRLSRNAQRVTKFYKLPSDRVCEMGAEIEL